MSDLFIGVVSHEGSRFARSQGTEGLAARLSTSLTERGVSCTVVVNTENLFRGTVTPHDVQRSLTAQLALDRQWAIYLDRPRGVSWWGGQALRWAHRAQQRIQAPGVGMVTRLMNIELSHVDLLRRGRASEAPWILILEDDADAPDVDDLADGLLGIMHAAGRQPGYVNISHSFSAAELGVSHLLSPVEGVRWQGDRLRTILGARKPVTNTVCAIAYRSSFVDDLLRAFDELPLDPVVPIDWKLNLALMALQREGGLGAGDCWQIDPAPILQLSMRDPLPQQDSA